ncbi:hypothetical protein [Kribbella sp. NPDC050459]|uniref:hypothetical protein n=1 Tax=Kribbella sp. NPDC050459 TaxID=3155785 RepID=UPI0033E3DFF6
MPLDTTKFASAFSDANHRRRTEQGFDIAAEQAQLRELLSETDSPEQRAWALDLIESLAEPLPPPREWSELYHEANRIHAEAYGAVGTPAERIAALELARRRIWEIADRASADEEADIRALTRGIEHLEDQLRYPVFPLDDEPPAKLE